MKSDFLLNIARATKNGHVGPFCAFVVLTLFSLLPLLRDISGSLPDLGDSLHNIWTWADNAARPAEGRNIFDANIFHPEKNVAAFAELQVIHTLLFAPLHFLTGKPALAYNLLLILAFLLTGFFVYLIAFELSRNRPLSFLAGVCVTFFSYRFAHLPHVQVLALQWMLIPLYFMLLYARTRKRWVLAAFFVSFLCQVASLGYTTAYLLIFAWGFLAWAFLYGAIRKSYPVRPYLKLGAAMVLAMVIVLPIYLPYLTASADGHIRGDAELKWYGLDLALLLSSVAESRAYGAATAGIRGFRADGAISSVFLGFSFIAMFVVAVASLSSRRLRNDESNSSREETSNRPPAVPFLVGMAIFFFFLLLGPIVKWRGEDVAVNPLNPLFRFFPLFKALRYVPNYVQPCLVALALLVALGLSRRKFFDRTKRGTGVAIALSGLFFVEHSANVGPVKAPPHGANTPNVYRFLAGQQPAAAVELPVATDRLSDPEQFLSMFYSIYHRMQIVNGVTGFFPNSYRRTIEIARKFPSDGAFKHFEHIGIKYVVVHRRSLPDVAVLEKRLASYSGFKEVFRDEQSVVLELQRGARIISNRVSGRTDNVPEGYQAAIERLRGPQKAQRGAVVKFTARVRNTGNIVWLADTSYEPVPGRGEVRLGLRYWTRSDGYVPKERGSPSTPVNARGRLPRDVFPGEEVDVSVEARVPEEPGEYVVLINLVSELVCWFQESDLRQTVSVE